MKFMTGPERDEWNEMLDEVNALQNLTTGERSLALMARLRDAEQAHLPWASIALTELAMQSCARTLKARAKHISTTLVTFQQAAAVRTMRVGVKSRSAKGVAGFQQKLFEEMTWSELDEHVKLLADQMRALGVSLAVDKKLLKLHEQCPESMGPGDAATKLGTTVADFLAGAAA